MKTEKESARLVEDLLAFYRDVLLYNNAKEKSYTRSFYQLDEFKTYANEVNNQELYYYIDVLNQTKQDLKYSSSHQIYVELALMKMVDVKEKEAVIMHQELDDLKEQVSRLQQAYQDLNEGLNRVENNVVKVEPPTPSIQVDQDAQPFNDEDDLVSETNPYNEEDDLFEDRNEAENDDQTEIDDTYLEEDHQSSSLFDDEDDDADAASLFDDNDDVESSLFEQETESPEDVQKEQPIFAPPKDAIHSGENTPSESVQEVQTEQTSEQVDVPYSTYDIRIVENVLNKGDRELRIELSKKWINLESSFTGTELEYAKHVSSGRIVATDGATLIMVYDTPTKCNRLMKPDTKEIVKKLLESHYNRAFDYMALPVSVWDDIFDEYIKKYQEGGTDFIKLTPINDPELKELTPTKHTFKEEQSEDQSVQDALDLFGDVVKVKRGE